MARDDQPDLDQVPRFRPQAMQRQPSVGPETKAVLALLHETINAMYDLAAVANAETFALSRMSTWVSVTPGTPLLLRSNNTMHPEVIHVRAQTFGSGATGYLFLATDGARATQQLAQVVSFGEVPKASVVLLPGGAAWADVTDTSPTLAGTAVMLNVVRVPLMGSGRQGLFGVVPQNGNDG